MDLTDEGLLADLEDHDSEGPKIWPLALKTIKRNTAPRCPAPRWRKAMPCEAKFNESKEPRSKSSWCGSSSNTVFESEARGRRPA
jgi:hypothetical protein